MNFRVLNAKDFLRARIFFVLMASSALEIAVQEKRCIELLERGKLDRLLPHHCLLITVHTHETESASYLPTRGILCRRYLVDSRYHFIYLCSSASHTA